MGVDHVKQCFHRYMIVKAISHAFLALGYDQNLCTNVSKNTWRQGQSNTMFWLVFTLHALIVRAWCNNTQRKPTSFVVLCFIQMSIHFSWKFGESSYFVVNFINNEILFCCVLPRHFNFSFHFQSSPWTFLSFVLLCTPSSFLFSIPFPKPDMYLILKWLKKWNLWIFLMGSNFSLGNKFPNVWPKSLWGKCCPNQTFFIPLKNSRNSNI